MLPVTDNIEPVGFSWKIYPQINANARKWIKNRVVIKFKVAWLCDLMIRIPAVFAIPGTGFRHSLPE